MVGKRYLQILNILGFIVLLAGLVAGFINIDLFLSPSVAASIPHLALCPYFIIPIWVTIGLSMLSFCSYQSQGIFRKDKQKKLSIEKIGHLFFLAAILNTGWLTARYFNMIVISLLMMIALLVVLIKIYVNIEAGVKVSSASEVLWVQLPFRIYLGWIMVITITELAAEIYLGWEGFGYSAVYWAVAVVAIITIAAFVFLKRRLDLAPSAVILWFFLGIAIKGFSPGNRELTIAISTVAGMLIIIGSALWFLTRKYVLVK